MPRYALSSNQQLVWTEQQLYPDLTTYCVAHLIVVETALDPARFERAFVALVASTDALRVVFGDDDGVPYQQFETDVRLEVQHLDFSDTADPVSSAREWGDRERRRPFPAGQPMFSIALIRLGPARSAWFYRQHHLLSDGATAQLLIRRLAALYDAAETGTPGAHAFGRLESFIAEQTAFEQTTEAGKARTHWDEVLSEPAERWPICRPVGSSEAGAIHTGARTPSRSSRIRLLSAEEIAAIDRTARELNPGVASLDAARVNTLTAIVAAAAWRVIGGAVLPIGVLFANRAAGRHDDVAGFLSTTGVLRVPIDGDSTIADLTERARHQFVEARRFSRVSAKNVGPGAFDLVVNYFRWRPELHMGGADAQHHILASGQEGSPAMAQFRADPSGRRIWMDLTFDGDVFDAASADAFAVLLDRMLQAGVDTSRVRIADLVLLGADERRQVEAAARGPKREQPPTVLDAIAHQVSRCPESTAVESGADSITYAELWGEARAVAAGLRATGCGDGEVAAVWMARSIDQIVALLGVWMAGAAYLPLDPGWPPARARELATRARVRVCISDATRPAIAPVQVGIAPLRDTWIGGDSETSRVPPDALAYVIYTSGSTGNPKGVEIAHGALANYVACVAERFELDGRDRVLQFSSLAFDTAAEEIFPVLTRGGTLVLREAVDSPLAFLDGCARQRITLLDLPTAYWHAIVEAAHATVAPIPRTLRLVVTGGEAMRRDRLAQWRAWTRGSLPLLNGYGPTEATIAATFADMTDAGDDRAAVIGRPVWNTETWVLDAAGQPLPPGLPGELCIAGAGLSRGYRGDPARTAERFVAFEGAAGGRVYRTGDRARWRADGELEFLGRADDQVKVRGVRVEPGEIERVLQAHPAVADAAVVAVGSGDAVRLVAHVVPSEAGAAPFEPAAPTPSVAQRRDAVTRGLVSHLRVSEAELLAWLAGALPPAMVPSAVTFTGALPRTPGGKVDRHRLRDDGAQVSATGRPPLGATEQWLARTWSELLGRDVADAEVSVFALGGHSLSVVRLAVRIESRFGLRLPIRVVFERPTIAALACEIDAAFARDAAVDSFGLLGELEQMSDADVLASLEDETDAPVGEGHGTADLR